MSLHSTLHDLTFTTTSATSNSQPNQRSIPLLPGCLSQCLWAGLGQPRASFGRHLNLIPSAVVSRLDIMSRARTLWLQKNQPIAICPLLVVCECNLGGSQFWSSSCTHHQLAHLDILEIEGFRGNRESKC